MSDVLEITIYLLASVVLLALNAFFVLAEFAVVKVRPSRITELQENGDRRAGLVAEIQAKLDEYLSVCQVGITFASVALGMVGKKATDAIMGEGGDDLVRYIIAMTVSYVVISGLHIVAGELIPKSVAIRLADRSALIVARPLRFFHALFFLPLWVLNRLANACLRLMGMPAHSADENHSEDELRIILDRSQSRGLLSFRRLLFIENVFDLGELRVKDAMRGRSQTRALHTQLHWIDTEQFIRTWRFSRYPLIDADPERPIGIIHIKDVFFAQREAGQAVDLKSLARPYLTTLETASLESLLAEMQRRRIHVALVNDAAGRWSGLISMEDIIEEIVGTIGDEFEVEEAVQLAEVLTAGRVVLGLEASSMIDAIRKLLAQAPAPDLPQSVEAVTRSVLDRERLAATYLGKGIAIPHARMPGLDRPVLLFARSDSGVPIAGSGEKATLLFMLLTPSGAPRVHQRMQAKIAAMIENSEYIGVRLREAQTAAEVIEIIRTGEQASLD